MDNIYDKYHISHIINASGKMTILGGSRLSEEVCEYMKFGANHFFEIKDLLNKTGDYLAQLIGVESAYIVNSASGAIAQSVASCISKGNIQDILHPYNFENKKREIVICKGHNVDYGTPIELTISLGGGKIIEAGYANRCTLEHVQSCINENTAALIYVKSHHCVQKEMPDIQSFIQLAHQNQLPVIIDAAAEEDLLKYYKMDGDIIIYSGTKALEGPTSGLIIGKKAFVEQIKKQSLGIGRVMKIGKENILGLVHAIECYLQHQHSTLEQQIQRLEPFNKKINQINGLSARCVQDEAGRLIIRSEITFLNGNALEIVQKLKEGKTKIYTRDYHANEGKIEIDIRDVTDHELDIIYEKIATIMKG